MKTNVAPSSCPQCGGPIPAEAREGLCPRCALAAVAATETERPGEPPPAAPTREAVAAALPQFEILEFIGQGGMGCVFKARQPQLDRVVALKILPAIPGREPTFTERFLREAKALARMSHPNIVTVHDSGQAGGFFYLVMEFVDGVSLRQLLREGRLAPEEALAIVPRICEALQYAHEQGVVHRDIKPENVLLDKQGRVKIADFGIAKLVGSTGPGRSLPQTPEASNASTGAPVEEEGALTQGHVLGTPNYMAPEQVERPGMVDHRADIYSLGVVFYEMLTGELPSGVFQPPSSKVQIDVRLDEIVLRALEQKPERRYQQASEVKTQVEQITATPPDRGTPEHKTSLDPVQLNSSMPGTAPWVALAALLLLTASGNATVMLIGSAVLLVIGLLWLPHSRWRIALLVALASMGVAGFAVLFLTRARPGSVENPDPIPMQNAPANPAVPALALSVTSDGSGSHESIQAALNDAVEGTVIRIGPGRYKDPLLITKSVSLIGAGWNETVIGPATPVAPPTPQEREELDRQFRAATTDEERNRLRTEARDRFFKPVVQVGNGETVSFEGIKFTLPGTSPEGSLQDSTVIEIGNARARFDACAIVGSPGNGIVLADGADVTLRNTLVAAAWNTGIRVARGTKAQLTVMDSDIRNCHYAGVVVGRGQNDVTIERCRVSGAAWHGIRYDHASPTISGNLIFANARSGIYASGVTAARVQGNVFWKNEMNGMSCWFENRDGITNNTFAANRREGLSVLGASNPAIERNIFWQHPLGIVQGNIGDNSTSAKAAAPLRIQHNLFWANEVNLASALHIAPGGTNGPASISIDTFPSNVEADPGFRDAANGDFSLLPNGAAATLGNGAQSALQPIGPWPLQPEEQAIIPEGNTRDSRQWKRTP